MDNKYYVKGKWKFTLADVCQIAGIEIDESLKGNKAFLKQRIKNVRVNIIPKTINRKGLLIFADKRAYKTAEKEAELIKAIEDGAMVIADKKFLDESGKEYTTICCENPKEMSYQIAKYIKNAFPMPTIGITGSVGKTTTTLFARCVFDEKYKVFISGEKGHNYNTPRAMLKQLIKRYGPDYNFHIQETGGGNKKLVESMAKIIDVDAFGISMIDTSHHIDNYKTPENIIDDKTSFDRYSKEDAFGVINKDDEILREYPFKHKIVTFAIKDQTADYVGKNIVQNGAWLEFDVDDHQALTHIKIQIPGTHNAYNALLVFALARGFGLTYEEIQSGFLKYESIGLRQSTRAVSGRNLYIDCFNVCAESIKSCLKTLDLMTVEEGKKKIAVIGGENALGEHLYEVNSRTGREIAQLYKDKIDQFIFFGPDETKFTKQTNMLGDGKAVYEGAKEFIPEDKICFISDINQLAKKLKETDEGDIILFKGIFRFPMFAAIDIAFGTAYLPENGDFRAQAKKVSDGNFEGLYHEIIDAVEITKYLGVGGKVKIPETIEGNKVKYLGKSLFANKDIRKVILNEGLVNIGERAFENTNIKAVVFPKSLQCIEDHAFSGCKKLKKAHLPENCKTVAKNAFNGCEKL